MVDYEPNSRKYKEAQQNAPVEKKEVKQVVSRPAKPKKKNGLAKLADIFIAEDAQNVKSYIVDDVLIPLARKGIWDLVTGTLDTLLNGKNSRRSTRTYGDRVSYENYSKTSRSRADEDPRPRTSFSLDECTIQSRAEAEEVLNRMDELLELYGMVTVADYYELVGVRNYEYTCNKYGWTDLRKADVVRYGGEYMIKLTRPHPLD